MSYEISLDCDVLSTKKWMLYYENGDLASSDFIFLPDGSIGGGKHEGYHYWIAEKNYLRFLNKEKIPTIILYLRTLDSGEMIFHGSYEADAPLPNYLVEILQHSKPRYVYDTRTYLFKQRIKYGWSVGEHTYGCPHVVGAGNFTIGKFCSIAAGVNIALENHRSDIITSYPFKVLKQFWKNVPEEFCDQVSKGDVVIGNDVWIGSAAFIGSGVEIGSGAVIGAGSIIVKNVPPYAVVVGNPGRVVRYRFDEKIIDKLLETCWWDLDDDTIELLMPKILSTDIAGFIEKVSHLRSKIAIA